MKLKNKKLGAKLACSLCSPTFKISHLWKSRTHFKMRVSENLASGLYAVEAYQVSEHVFPSLLNNHLVLTIWCISWHCLAFIAFFQISVWFKNHVLRCQILIVSSLIEENIYDYFKFVFLDHSWCSRNCFSLTFLLKIHFIPFISYVSTFILFLMIL